MKFYTNVYMRGANIYCRGYEDGKNIKEVVKYKPYLFVGTSNSDKSTKYRNHMGKPVHRMDFDTIYEAREFVRSYKDVANMELYGMTNYPYVYLNDAYPGVVEYDIEQINVISIDIETDSKHGYANVKLADKEILSVQLSRRGERLLLGLKDYTPKNKKTTYIKCADEYEMLQKFLHLWQSGRWCPDIVTGWNIMAYDIPYLVNRIARVLGENEAKKLSPHRFIDEKLIKNKYDEDEDIQTYSLAGISILDYMEIYKKFSFSNHSSYSLDAICEEELDIKKVDYKTEYGSLAGLYEKNPQLFYSYGERDVELIDLLEEKLKFIEQIVVLAYDAKVNYNDTLTTVRPWDVIVHNHLMERAVVVPFMDSDDMIRPDIVGGYVKEPIPGMYKWVVSVDFTALYPRLLQSLNISPETLLGKAQMPSIKEMLNGVFERPNKNNVYAVNGAMFSRSFMGFMPTLVEKEFNERVTYKRMMIDHKKQLEKVEHTEMDATEKKKEIHRLKNLISKYNNLQMAKKIKLNSLYGALANIYFRWFNTDMAEAITMTGQLAAQWVEKYLNQYLNRILKTIDVDYVIAMDTDSVVGDSEIYINGTKNTIENTYNLYCNQENLISQRDKNDFVHDVTKLNLFTKTVDYKNEKVIDDKIKNIMKHKVKKRMFKITVDNKSVVITEDHSIMVERDNKLISLKATEILPGDNIIYINTTDTDQYRKEQYKCINKETQEEICPQMKK